MSKLKPVHRGDDGYTDLGSERVWKGSTEIELLGSIDELVAAIGVAKCFLSGDLANLAHEVQQYLMEVCGMIAARRFDRLSEVARFFEERTRELWNSNQLRFRFVIPGPPEAAAFLHLARTICRRAERWAWRAHREGSIPRQLAIALNRLSDLLYAMSLAVEKRVGTQGV